MRPPRLYFVGGKRLSGATGFALLAAGVLCLAYAVLGYNEINGRNELLQAQLRAAAPVRERAGTAATTKQAEFRGEELRRKIQLAAQVVQRKSVPWDRLFRDIEDATNKDVGLLSIQPEANNRVLRIDGEARDLAALTDYIARLKGRPSLHNVHLVAHELRNESGQRSVRFGLNATWEAS
ncbi:MAG: PilN domain-containing protein [Betaproteobacteria bacterium]